MQDIRPVQRKVRTLKALRGVLNVWNTLAVNRYRRYSPIASGYRAFLERLREVAGYLVRTGPRQGSELLREREETRVDLLILTSDRGYVGGFVEAVLKETVSFIGRNPGKDFRLFVVGKRWSQTIPAEVFEGVLTKDVDWSAVEKVGEVLISRFRNGFSDACYVIFQRPAKDTPAGGGLAKIQGTTVSIEQAPLLYGVFEHPYESGFSSGPEAGGYRPLTLRFLPPQAKETPRSALNIEGDEDMFVEGVLRMYLEVFLKSVFLDHFTALNLARQRTLRRVMKKHRRKTDPLQEPHQQTQAGEDKQ
ncbi:MAG: FoF1 ATP synthase subunit gamma [Aquificota bacterium]|nr:FoF1 ATP synthase subunit gamma [Aquificota bacterium]